MKNLKNKKGISLIVLILTIIVMIILATAIILSLNNSGIIGKANKAKQDSDTASLKEYVNVLKAEWELMSETERGDYDTSTEYVNAKLEAEGYNRMLNDDGILLTEGATLAIKAGLEIGDEVTGYNELLKAKSEEEQKYETDGNENTNPEETGTEWDDVENPQTIKVVTTMTWNYMGISEDGNIQIVPDMTNIPSNTEDDKYTMMISGSGSFWKAPDVINDACKTLYKTTKGTARSMDAYDVIDLLGYTGPVFSEYNEYDRDGLLSADLRSSTRTRKEYNDYLASIAPDDDPWPLDVGYFSNPPNDDEYKMLSFTVEKNSEYITKDLGKSIVYSVR